jgi:magnesium transporter
MHYWLVIPFKKKISLFETSKIAQIAVGTGILLFGVLALSWRLSGEPTQTPVAQSALAPGMGFVDDTSEDDGDGNYRSDEEIAIGGERQALLQGDALTPTTKYDRLLSATRLQRRGMTEADEIWGELEDDATRYPGPLPRRSISGISTVSRLRRSDDDATHETTSELRPVTSRSNRSRRKRPGSSHFRKPSEEQSPQIGTPKVTKSQSALGGWWRMEWWKRRRDLTPAAVTNQIPGSGS